MEINSNDNLGTAAPTQTGTTATTTQAVQSESSQQGTGTSQQSTTSEVNNSPTQKEELILGKFKTQEDMVKSYQELEKQMSQTAEARKRAELLEEYAKVKGVSAQEIEKELRTELEAEQMRASGITDPNVFRMQQQVRALEAQMKQSSFEQEFSTLSATYPAIVAAKDTLKGLFLQSSSSGKTLSQIVSEVYLPVIAQAEQAAITKLNGKEASNSLSPRLGDTKPVFQAQQLEALKREASGDVTKMAQYLEMKRKLQQQ